MLLISTTTKMLEILRSSHETFPPSIFIRSIDSTHSSKSRSSHRNKRNAIIRRSIANLRVFAIWVEIYFHRWTNTLILSALYTLANILCILPSLEITLLQATHKNRRPIRWHPIASYSSRLFLEVASFRDQPSLPLRFLSECFLVGGSRPRGYVRSRGTKCVPSATEGKAHGAP